jgi:hypothetical protein
MLTKITGVTAFTISLVAASVGVGFSSPQSRLGSGIAVADLSPSQMALVGRWVEDSSGRPIGRIRSVDVGREGKAEVVNIEVGQVRLSGTQIVAVNAHQIVYYPQRGKLVASFGPSPVSAPSLPPGAPERAAIKRPPPEPTIFQN